MCIYICGEYIYIYVYVYICFVVHTGGIAYATPGRPYDLYILYVLYRTVPYLPIYRTAYGDCLCPWDCLLPGVEAVRQLQLYEPLHDQCHSSFFQPLPIWTEAEHRSNVNQYVHSTVHWRILTDIGQILTNIGRILTNNVTKHWNIYFVKEHAWKQQKKRLRQI